MAWPERPAVLWNEMEVPSTQTAAWSAAQFQISRVAPGFPSPQVDARHLSTQPRSVRPWHWALPLARCSQARALQPPRDHLPWRAGRRSGKSSRKIPFGDTFLINEKGDVYTHTHTHTHTHTPQKITPHVWLGPLQDHFRLFQWEGENVTSSPGRNVPQAFLGVKHLYWATASSPSLRETRGWGEGRDGLNWDFTSSEEPTLRLGSHLDNGSFPGACTACSGANVLTFGSFFKCSEHDVAQLICTC